MILLICLLLTACGPSIEYVGKSYPSTSHVDIYPKPADINRSYEIIGKATGKAWVLTDWDNIKARMVKEARKKGADGIVFTKIGEELVIDSKDSTAQHAVNAVWGYFIRYR